MVSVFNALIGVQRHTEVATFSGGSWESDYGVANLGALPLARVARSVDLAAESLVILVTFPSPRLVRTLGFINHNGDEDCVFSAELFESASWTGSLVASGPQLMWPPLRTLWQQTFPQQNFFTCSYTAAEIAASNSKVRVYRFEQAYVAQSLRIDIANAQNAAGYFQMGMLDISHGWQVAVNFALGAELGLESLERVQRARGGVSYIEDGSKLRQWRGTIPYLPKDEALERGFEFQKEMGLKTPFLFVPNPADPKHWSRNAGLFRNKTLPRLVEAEGGRMAFTLDIEEVI